jgi:hypothetical protein
METLNQCGYLDDEVTVDLIEGPLGAAAKGSGLNWPTIRRHVSRLQTRIVKVTESERTQSPGASRCLIKA